MSVLIAFFALAGWLYLLVGRGGFWLARERDDRPQPPQPATWPSVMAVIPARDEAASIGQTVRSLLAQGYPGLRIIVVDDASQDGTGDLAHAAGATVVQGQPLLAGWTGKVWALKQGVAEALRGEPPRYLLLTDADIDYAPGALKRIVARAEAGRTALTSVMVKLSCESPAERAFIPAFVFFFQMLYPFARVNRPEFATAAAAGGCMLVRSDALQETGGIDGIRGALIDDCALAAQLKSEAPIWLGLTESVRSTRSYPGVQPIRVMVTRSAYAELDYSPLRLVVATLGMALMFLSGPLLAVFASGMTALIGAAVWLMMGIAFQPTLRLYRLNPLWGFALPLIALVYMIWTIESAWQCAQGQGGQWKGRAQAPRGAPRSVS